MNSVIDYSAIFARQRHDIDRFFRDTLVASRAVTHMESPFESFLRFVVGFTVFISVSFGVTYAVNTYSQMQEVEKQTASAFQAMIIPEM
ncbi:MAG: hypothetical protein G01um10148_194 [Parcubacteria group bacterium Gr01-1014_8]|nr:MAG: hypothetical protein G01um10148_194 [Parcubacteria group bacterium Gr01-1014_8]